ncbi:Protein of unknown function [Solimonas aquatica]|uniref:DUF1329 domain-containing protein n=2 Tax=Solimonas aquatica TaxID=489703 RepID=A0A1H9LHR3_9GAMM|nr:Protein of unknown function [Solimonas aquatica]
MHIRKYDFNYSRRMFMEKTLRGSASAGVLCGIWPLLASGKDLMKAYPDELVSIEVNTKGKVKPGDVITANNVEHVKHLLTEIDFKQIKEDGRKIIINDAPAATPDYLFPLDYYEASVRNAGRAGFDAGGNLVDSKGGGKWIGGAPFMDPKDAVQAYANMTYSWGRHDFAQYAIRDWDINPDGSQAYAYEFLWIELNTTNRIREPRVFKNFENLLRLNTVLFTSPQEQAGSSFLSEWYYDQSKFPELYGYMPLFRRVRQFPTNQRFEPLVPGITMFLSDAWGAGDPMLTWGNYRIVDRRPMLVGGSGRNFFEGIQPDGKPPVHGGPKGQSYWDMYMELCPEALVIDSEPTGYPRAPVGRRRVYVDARNSMLINQITYDRRGDLWKTVIATAGPKNNGKKALKNSHGHVEWGVQTFMIHDIQSNRLSRFYLAPQITGGHKTAFEADETAVYDGFLTKQALTRLGAA